MPFLAALAPLIGIGTAAGGATTAASVLGALGTLGGIAGAGTTIGETIANSGGNKAPTVPAPTPPNASQLAQQRALVAQQTPNVVGATSGLASPGYDSLIAQILAGTLGQPGSTAAGNAATGQNFSPVNAQPTNAAVQGQPIQLSDFVNNFSGGQQ
jgi:hypothetical protein